MVQKECSIRTEKSPDLHLGGQVNISPSLSIVPVHRARWLLHLGLCEESQEVIYTEDVLTPVRSMYKW